MRSIFTMALVCVSLAAFLAACGDTANTNTNTRTNTVTNLGTNNANVGAIVVNSNANTNVNRWANANSVTRDDYNKNRADYEKDKGTSTIGSGANDSWLWFKTRAALMTTDDLRDSTINVDVENEVITLKGTVATAAQKAAAAKVANGIEGKKSVVNQLNVSANDSVTNTGGNSNTNKR